MLQGSPNVLIGDYGCGDPPGPPAVGYNRRFILVDEQTQKPLVDREYRIVRPNGDVIVGRTDERGYTTQVETSNLEALVVDILEADETTESC